MCNAYGGVYICRPFHNADSKDILPLPLDLSTYLVHEYVAVVNGPMDCKILGKHSTSSGGDSI